MKLDKFKELTTILFKVVVDRKIKSLTEIDGKPNKLNGVFIGSQGNDIDVIVEYYPKYDSIRAHSETMHFSESCQVKTLEQYVIDGTTHEILEQPIMTRRELVKKVKSGKINFKLHGHFAGFNGNNEPYTKNFKEEIIKTFKDDLDNMNGANDGKWNYDNKDDKRTHEELDASMRDFYRRKVERNLMIGSNLFRKKPVHVLWGWTPHYSKR